MSYKLNAKSANLRLLHESVIAFHGNPKRFAKTYHASLTKNRPCPLILLLKWGIDSVLPILTEIVNQNLTDGYMSTRRKESLLSPIQKNPMMSDSKNFRPISNLPFMPKIFERIVVDNLSLYC